MLRLHKCVALACVCLNMCELKAIASVAGKISAADNRCELHRAFWFGPFYFPLSAVATILCILSFALTANSSTTHGSNNVVYDARTFVIVRRARDVINKIVSSRLQPPYTESDPLSARVSHLCVPPHSRFFRGIFPSYLFVGPTNSLYSLIKFFSLYYPCRHPNENAACDIGEFKSFINIGRRRRTTSHTSTS